MSSSFAVQRRSPWMDSESLVRIIKSAAINFLLPFINGVMLGFGEILANELVFKYGWFGHARILNPGAASVGVHSAIPLTATGNYKKVLQEREKILHKDL